MVSVTRTAESGAVESDMGTAGPEPVAPPGQSACRRRYPRSQRLVSAYESEVCEDDLVRPPATTVIAAEAHAQAPEVHRLQAHAALQPGNLPLMPVPFGGLGVALITLFDQAGEVAAQATAEHAARLASLGVRIVLVCGSTGEAATLKRDERIRLIRAVRAALPDTVPVLAGTGAETTSAAADLTKDARDAGADAILALSPPGSGDLLEYYSAIADAAAQLPVLAYHFPTMSAPGIPLDVLPQLSVAGLKDSTRDVQRVTAELTEWHGSVFVGSTTMLELARTLGGAGAILGIANVQPEICAEALGGDSGAQRRLAELSPEANRDFPLGIKELTAARFGTSTVVRAMVGSTA